jgi:3-(3-hydroxy-phenyl)propionate hydroxylase
MKDLGFEQRWLVLDVASEVELDQWDGVHQVCDPHRAATYMRIGPSRYRWEFRLLEGETASDYDSMEAVLALIGPWVGGVPEGDLELVRAAEYTFRAQIADSWRDRNVFLLGDAAHLTPPFIGQGLCAGLRDAMNLGWKLAGVLAGSLPGSVLDSYETERKPHALSMIKLAKLIGAAMTQGGRAGNALRRLIAPRLHLLPGLRDRILDSETPPLTRSDLVHRARFGGTLAGRLCPNALLEDGHRLDDLVGDGFLLVTRAAPSGEQRALLVERGTQVLQVDPASELGTWLSKGRAVAALVRPDQAVMRAGRDLAALTAAAPRFVSC